MSCFFTLEGGEGAGKTTLIGKLANFLMQGGRRVLTTRAPGGTPLGAKLRELLLNQGDPIAKKTELLLFLADRAQHVEEVINPSLQEGLIVLSDRFTDSTLAYQGALEQFDFNDLEFLCSFASSHLIPKHTFLLDIDPEVGLERVRKEETRDGVLDRIEQKELDFHKKVRELFLKNAEKNKDRITVLDAKQNPDTLLHECIQILKRYSL